MISLTIVRYSRSLLTINLRCAPLVENRGYERTGIASFLCHDTGIPVSPGAYESD